MKRIFMITLGGILCFLLLSACSTTLTPPTNETVPSAAEGISDAAYCDLFQTRYYYSLEEAFQGLKDFPESELESLSYRENLYMEDTRKNTYVSEDELKNGIFGNMRTKLLEEEIFLAPHYQAKSITLDKNENQSITIIEAYAFRKPWIIYRGAEGPSFQMMHIDSSLVESANEKGASWLSKELDSNAPNVYNYEDIIKISMENGIMAMENMIVYEQTCSLGDRDVIALVIDNSKNEMYPSLGIYFVYDDMFIQVIGRPEIVEAVLPDLTFHEVHMPTGKLLREEPGREWSKWSNAKGVDVEDVKQDNPLEAAE